MSSAALGRDREDQVLKPGRLWDLWEMYNFYLNDFARALTVIEIFGLRSPISDRYLTKEQREVIVWEFEPLVETLRGIELDGAADQLANIVSSLRSDLPSPSRESLETRCQVLLQTIHSAAEKSRFYYYPNDSADLLENLDSWFEPAFKAFKSAKPEIEAGVDLWALGHNTASVFHMMRATEVGLRWLAKRMKVTFARKPTEWGQWGELLSALDKKVVALRGTTPGPKRDADLKFYSEAVIDMRALAERRDAVMHVRRDFDRHEARSTIDRVHHLLTGLSARATKKKG